MTMPPEELRAAIEAILFVSGEPVTVEDLAEVLTDANREQIESALEEIRLRFDTIASGIALEQAAGGFRFATRAQFDPFLRKVFSRRNEGRLSIAALETLAIIAYRQPITSPEISDIRGVNSSAVLRTLLERRMVRIAGRKNVVGSPFLYRTTKDFLVHFGLNEIRDLPQLEEFTEILGENVIEEFAGETGGGGRFEFEESSEGDTFEVPRGNPEVPQAEESAQTGHADAMAAGGDADPQEVRGEAGSELSKVQTDRRPSRGAHDTSLRETNHEDQDEAIEVMSSNERQN